MTKYTYTVEKIEPEGCKITVTRSVDGAEKVFTVARVNSIKLVKRFMDSITDVLADDYFPKPRKNK